MTLVKPGKPFEIVENASSKRKTPTSVIEISKLLDYIL
jgi:hypothetical protein